MTTRLWPLLALVSAAGIAAGLLASGARGDAMAEAWRLVYLLTLAPQVAALVLWTVRARRAKRWATEVELGAIRLALLACADLAGVWRLAHPIEAWARVSVPASAVGWCVVAGVQVWRWRRLRAFDS